MPRKRGAAAFLEGLAQSTQNIPQILALRRQEEAQKERDKIAREERKELLDFERDRLKLEDRQERLRDIRAQGAQTDQMMLQLAKIIQGEAGRGISQEQLAPLQEAAGAQQQLDIPNIAAAMGVAGGAPQQIGVARPDIGAFAQALGALPGMSGREEAAEDLDRRRIEAAIEATEALTAQRRAPDVEEPKPFADFPGSDAKRVLDLAQADLDAAIAELPRRRREGVADAIRSTMLGEKIDNGGLRRYLERNPEVVTELGPMIRALRDARQRVDATVEIFPDVAEIQRMFRIDPSLVTDFELQYLESLRGGG
jgi:hypothetical protein